ncbi:hypothetical protein tpqmel_0666 [Candidatus Gastranaerophilus sp. (ex Termes propinquus)]|nr:hypothetical protein tpqmel_0666 [Candidatus Gastranaerophilus sp. (ex Termes propinquus)]
MRLKIEPYIDLATKFVKKLRPLDIIIISIVTLALFVGVFTLLGKRATSSGQIEVDNTKVAIEIFFRGVVVTSANSPFKEGDETFITIRNVPYTKLKIKDVKFDRKKAIVPTLNAKQPFAVVDDVSSPFQFDFLVTVMDNAKITKDGAVVGGNKIKIGMPTTLEGVDYRLNGIVTNITLSAQPASQEGDTTEQVQDSQDAH